MAIPTVFAPVKREDFTLRPFPVHKEFRLSSVDLVDSSSGYNIVAGVHTSLKTPIGSHKAFNDPTNSWDGSYQHVIWQAYNHLYYKFPYDSYGTLEHSNKRYTFKFLNYSASIFSIPAMDYGERIKPGSVFISNSSHAFSLTDDVNGNLYDSSITTGSFTRPYGIVGYWSFNDVFRRFRYRDGKLENGSIGYISRTFEVDEPSYCKNVSFEVGVPISGTGSGMAAKFYDGNDYGYIITHNRPEFNFTSDDDFTIAFWVKTRVDQSIYQFYDYNPIITKRGVVRKQVAGINSKYNQSDLLISTMHISSSIEDLHTDVYPYEFLLVNTDATSSADIGKIRFRRSDGVTTLLLQTSSSIVDDEYTHVAVTKRGTLVTLYFNGIAEASGTDKTIHPVNQHSLIFGGINRAHQHVFDGTIDEVRIYDYAVPSESILTLADNTNMSLYQTAVVGNVFYRQGNIVISPLDMKYLSTFTGTWDVMFKGTHTIYQYEVLCRVKKGSFNLTYNPTARRSPKSDLLIDDMTGSLLMPYATTIGLYNDVGDLVAVAKLGQPIQMRDDVDLNFLVRWDA